MTTLHTQNLVTPKGLKNVDTPHGTSLSNGSFVSLVHWVNQRAPRTTTPRAGGAMLRNLQFQSGTEEQRYFVQGWTLGEDLQDKDEDIQWVLE